MIVAKEDKAEKINIKVFIINLRRSVQRRASIIEQMDKHGIGYELFPAVDGKEIDDETMRKIHSISDRFKETYFRDMERGEAGAALSHIGIYKKIVVEKIDCAIILEDDVEFDDRLKKLVDNYKRTRAVLRHYDLVLLGYSRNDLNYKKKADCSYWGRIELYEKIKVGAPVHWYWAAIGYLVSYGGAQKLLSHSELPEMQADYLTANSPAYGLKLGLTLEPIIWPGDLNNFSTIRVSKEEKEQRNSPYKQEFVVERSNQKLKRKKDNNFIEFMKTRYRKLRVFILTEKLKLSSKPYKFIKEK